MVASWNVCPAKVHVVSRQAYQLTVSEEFGMSADASIYYRKAHTPGIKSREITVYVVKAEGHTWSSYIVRSRKGCVIPELKTKSKATALIVAGRLVEKLRAAKIKDVVDIEKVVYDLIEEMGGDIKPYPDSVDLDELIRNQRDAIHKSGPRRSKSR